MKYPLHYTSLFQSLSFQKQFQPAIHLGDILIDDYASALLSGIFGRKIYAEGKRTEFYYWSIKIRNEPISESELEKLYDIIGANEYDKTSQSNEIGNESYITELCQEISQKLFSKILPFEISVSFADDEGIWLIGNLIETDISKDNAE